MSERSAYMQKRVRDIPVMHDLAVRFRIMEQYHDYAQVLTLNLPPIEIVAGPKESPGLAKLANDSMADLVAKYPKHFPAFVASLPLNKFIDCGMACAGAAGDQLADDGARHRGTNVHGQIANQPRRGRAGTPRLRASKQGFR